MGDLMFGDMSCNIKVDTQKVRAYIYMEFQSAFLCFFMECAHCQKRKHNKKNTNYFTLSSGLFTVNDHDPKYAISVVQVNRMLYIAIVS